jgi:hypothetical protein
LSSIVEVKNIVSTLLKGKIKTVVQNENCLESKITRRVYEIDIDYRWW